MTNGHAGDAVNLSVGEDSISTILDQQVQNTAARGIYIAIAAAMISEPAINFSPGRANGANIFTVSAIDSLDNFASFSNYGNDVVDYAAPGRSRSYLLIRRMEICLYERNVNGHSTCGRFIITEGEITSPLQVTPKMIPIVLPILLLIIRPGFISVYFLFEVS